MSECENPFGGGNAAAVEHSSGDGERERNNTQFNIILCPEAFQKENRKHFSVFIREPAYTKWKFFFSCQLVVVDVIHPFHTSFKLIAFPL